MALRTDFKDSVPKNTTENKKYKMTNNSDNTVSFTDVSILGIAGIVICGIYVVATCTIGTGQDIAMALFTAIVQGILVAGLSNYVNQLIKQSGKEE